jgi:uncharacterized protein
MRSGPTRLWLCALGLAGTLAALSAAVAQEYVPPLRVAIDPPGEREFIRDLAGLVKPADANRIRGLCDQLLTDLKTPILVVTVDSLSQYGGEGMRIDTFARMLFDQWGIGFEKRDGRPWNTGILLLVSRGDRRARIELGGGWKHQKDALCQRIMDERIIPRFKSGDYSAGILDGVEGLEAMVRGKELPRQPASRSVILFFVIGAALLVFTFVSLARRGTRGMAWLLWGGVFGLVGMVLYSAMTRRTSGWSSGGSSGGWSGGSFGGGSGGGGGASGSW